MRKTVLTGIAIATAMFLAHAPPASAAPIVGNVNLVGDFQPVAGGANTQNMALADGIDFLPNNGGTGAFATGSANGDLAAFANQSGGTIKDLTFAPFSAVDDFYTITVGAMTLSFNLMEIEVVSQNATFLTLIGRGLMQLTGFDPTEGMWNFSGESSNGSSSTATFSWSAAASAPPDDETPVPEPGALALLGLGFLGVGLLRRRKGAA